MEESLAGDSDKQEHIHLNKPRSIIERMVELKAVADLRSRVASLEAELSEAKHENAMYQKYIENLLAYNNQLVFIIENELNVAHKITTLCPISEKSENVECRSYTAKITEENESVSQGRASSNSLAKIQSEINMLLDLYNQKFLQNKAVVQSQLKEVISLMESDKQEYKAFHQNSMERLQAKQNELAAILYELRSSIEESAGRAFSERRRSHGQK